VGEQLFFADRFQRFAETKTERQVFSPALEKIYTII